MHGQRYGKARELRDSLKNKTDPAGLSVAVKQGSVGFHKTCQQGTSKAPPPQHG